MKHNSQIVLKTGSAKVEQYYSKSGDFRSTNESCNGKISIDAIDFEQI